MNAEILTAEFRKIFEPDKWYPWENAIRNIRRSKVLGSYNPKQVLAKADQLNLLEHGPTLAEFNVSRLPPHPCPLDRQVEFDGFVCPDPPTKTYLVDEPTENE